MDTLQRVTMAMVVAFLSACTAGGASRTDVIAADADDGTSECPDPRRYATGVAFLGGWQGSEIAVAKGDPTDEDAYRVSFVAFHDTGEEVEEVDRVFDWEFLDPSLVGMVMLDTSGSRRFASLRVQSDIFDVGVASGEPRGNFRVCVRNACPDTATAARCGIIGCAPRVCTDDIPVVSVVSLEGQWFIQGISTGFSAGTVTFRQQGRELRTVIDEVRPVVRNDRLVFFLGDDRYEGVIHPERTHIEGTVVRTNDLGEDVLFGQWIADKAVNNGGAQ